MTEADVSVLLATSEAAHRTHGRGHDPVRVAMSAAVLRQQGSDAAAIREMREAWRRRVRGSFGGEERSKPGSDSTGEVVSQCSRPGCDSIGEVVSQCSRSGRDSMGEVVKQGSKEAVGDNNGAQAFLDGVTGGSSSTPVKQKSGQVTGIPRNGHSGQGPQKNTTTDPLFDSIFRCNKGKGKTFSQPPKGLVKEQAPKTAQTVNQASSKPPAVTAAFDTVPSDGLSSKPHGADTGSRITVDGPEANTQSNWFQPVCPAALHSLSVEPTAQAAQTVAPAANIPAIPLVASESPRSGCKAGPALSASPASTSQVSLHTDIRSLIAYPPPGGPCRSNVTWHHMQRTLGSRNESRVEKAFKEKGASLAPLNTSDPSLGEPPLVTSSSSAASDLDSISSDSSLILRGTPSSTLSSSSSEVLSGSGSPFSSRARFKGVTCPKEYTELANQTKCSWTDRDLTLEAESDDEEVKLQREHELLMERCNRLLGSTKAATEDLNRRVSQLAQARRRMATARRYWANRLDRMAFEFLATQPPEGGVPGVEGCAYTSS